MSRGRFNSARRNRFHAACLSCQRYPDQHEHNRLASLQDFVWQSEAVSAFQRGGRGSIRDRAG